MKKVAAISGVIVFLIGSFNVIKYLSSYNELAPYGRGYVWGNVILIIVGLALTYYGLKKRVGR